MAPIRSKLLFVAIVIFLAFAPFPIFAQSYAVEGLTPGPIVGQDGWVGSNSAIVDNTLFSPMDGSTESVRFRGNGNFITVSRSIGTTVNTGVKSVSYDLYMTPRTTSNQVMRVGFNQSAGTEIFTPYAQSGGPGIAQNARLDPDGLGGAAYGYNFLITNFSYQPNHWYRFAATLDFDQGQIRNARIYDVASGSLQLVASSNKTFYFNNNGSAFYKNWGVLALDLDPATSTEGWNFDNFHVTDVPAYYINCGGPAVLPFAADQYFNGGYTTSTSTAIDLTEASNAAPLAVYQTERYVYSSSTNSYIYALPNLIPNAAYTVRLHFADLYYSSVGNTFNVSLNGTTVLSNFDLIGVTGARYKAIVQSYAATADTYGQITVQFTSGNGYAQCSGIEVSNGANPTPLPAAPTGLTATTTTTQATLTWNPVPNATGYIVQRSTSPFGPFARINTALLTNTTYTEQPLNYANYYRVLAVNISGVGLPSGSIGVTLMFDVARPYAINCGGPAISPFFADQLFDSGSTRSTSTAIDLTEASNAAQSAIYQTERYNNILTYILPNLTPNAAYTVRLHFADLLNSSTGYAFNVSLNGTTVLSNFDLIGVTGKSYKAIVQSYTATADTYGQIAVQFTSGSGNGYAQCCGIEILNGANPTPLPSAPTGLTATTTTTQATLTWNAVSSATGYIVQRSTSPFGPFARVNTALLTSPAYTDTPGNFTVYYRILSVNTSGVGLSSATLGVALKQDTVRPYAINCGGPAVSPFFADQLFNGGYTTSTSTTIDTSEANNPALPAVYQTIRYYSGSILTYTLPNLTPNAVYTVRLHFADLYYSSVGNTFNVSLNGTTVLSNFDLIGVTGKSYKAIVQSYTTVADNYGQITMQFLGNGYSYAQCCGIEILSGVNAIAIPETPTGLTAGYSNGNVMLNWNAVPGATGYIVQRSTSPFGPFARVNTTLFTGPAYTDSNVTDYYTYRVIAVNASGVGAASTGFVAGQLFSLAANASTVTVNRDDSNTSTIVVKPGSSLRQTVPNISLITAGVPSGVTAWFFPDAVSLIVPLSSPILGILAPNVASSNLYFYADPNATPGTYKVLVTAAQGANSATTTVTLIVK